MSDLDLIGFKKEVVAWVERTTALHLYGLKPFVDNARYVELEARYKDLVVGITDEVFQDAEFSALNEAINYVFTQDYWGDLDGFSGALSTSEEDSERYLEFCDENEIDEKKYDAYEKLLNALSRLKP